ncbi:hypothetical protein BSKO_03265 [Bryopsis sp. KO-2023]|nr:hypothetical protein BSKO_03265 [Bryopsis sp. KO-2023]
MVGFGESLKQAQLKEWTYAYLSYELLKDQLELIVSAVKALGPRDKLDRVRPLKIMFQKHLESEIIKILQFYEVTFANIRDVKDECIRTQEELSMQDSELAPELKLALINRQREQWRDLANTTVDLLEYISLNMQGLRKIVKKHSKNVEPLMPSKDIGATRVFEIHHPNEPGKKLIQATFLSDEHIDLLTTMQEHEELQEMCQTIRRALAELQFVASKIESSTPISMSQGSSLEMGCSPLDWQSDDMFLFDLRDRRDPGHGSHHSQRSLMLWQRTVKNIQDHEPILEKLAAAAADAQKNASLVSVEDDWFAKQAAIFTAPPRDTEAVATKLGLFLNLLSTFLYMANYNLVIPFISPFCERIGVAESYGGIMVGAADISAMIAAIFYSIWTNHSFRQPMVFTAVVLIVSNAMYSIAYDWGGLPLLMTARLITGFGAARSLNRRYIADFVKKENRTLASAAFVGSSSLGMAMGPFLAIPLDGVGSRKWLGLTFNNVTLAGWVMCGAWVVFLVVSILFFAEPPRRKVPESEQSLLSDYHQSSSGSSSNGDAHDCKTFPEFPKRSTFKFHKDPSFFPTMVMVTLLFALKLEQQGAVSSLPMFTNKYGWSESNVGLFLAIMGVVVIPVNLMMGVLSKYAKDQVQCLFTNLLCLVGSVIIIGVPYNVFDNDAGELGRLRYFSGFTIVYVATIVMEGAAMSLMSKVIAPEMALGTFNAGLLATDSGSFGRFIGNLAVTLIGHVVIQEVASDGKNKAVVNISMFGDISFGAYAILSIMCIILVAASYKRLKQASH